MKFVKLILSIFVFALLIGIKPLYAQTIIASQIETFTSKRPFEKAYLQFDKPYYAAGDTIYFKAYITVGERHNLSALSGVLHVDLINTKSKVNRSIKLPVANGVSWGDFSLPDSLPPGNYRVRAYTNWMRNEGESAFFEKIIPVGSTQRQRIPENNTVKLERGKADLQFFPEGGDLVADVANRIAFKALSTNGKGVGLSGIVINNEGETVASFAATHLGMGYFIFIPRIGENYKTEVTYSDGTKAEIALPLAGKTGIRLSVNNDSLQKVSVKIEANNSYYETNKGKDYTLLILSGGIVTTVKCKLDRPVINLDIVKRRLFTGVTRITLFSPELQPLCERLVFIQKFDQLNLDVSSGKPRYKARDQTMIRLNVRTRADSAAIGHFSVSVTDESKVPVDENNETTILTDLLLTSDLKGNIEQPNYYFTNVTDQKLKDLDLVMLTHGYRHFTWKTVMDNASDPMKYLAETGLSINGKVTNLFGKPISKAAVALMPVEYKGLLSDTTDNNGEFHFNNLSFTDSAKFVLQAVNKKGKNTTRLILDKDEPSFAASSMQVLPPFSAYPNMDTYLANARKEQEAALKYGLGKTRLLKEVKIRALKKDDDYPSSSIGGPGHANQVVHAEELEKTGGPLSIKLAGKFHGEYGWLITANRFAGLIIVDGAELTNPNPKGAPIKIDDAVDGSNIETVELFYGPNAAIYGMQAAYGVLVITTKRGGGRQPKDIVSLGVLPITVQGFYKAREFYSPRYDAPLAANPRPDLRSTIYWNPAIVTDKNGNASFNFYNADSPGNYRVVVEGMDNKGNIGRKVVYVKVE